MHEPGEPGTAAPQRLDVEFTGSGSEYLRIWIVNLLLTAVTLSLYHPYAKARKLAYFHANTRVGGQAMGFHGDPRKMLRGHLLIMLFGVAYAGASRLSPTAALVAVVSLVSLWPALWRASLQFRLGNTSWRGLRLGFSGSLGGAYRALLPGIVPWLATVGLSTFLSPGEPEDAETVVAPAAQSGLWFLAVLLLFLTLVPLSLAWIKRYQHGHYVIAGQRSRLDAGTGRFYVYALKLAGLMLLLGGVAGVALWGLFATSGGHPHPGGILFTMIAFYGVLFVVVMPFGRSRLQNLVWGHTVTPSVKCHSALALWPLVRLTLKNLLLTALTLGLYWPFAAVANSRMRLQALSFELHGDISQWTAANTGGTQDAAGEAAGDFFGIDLGL